MSTQPLRAQLALHDIFEQEYLTYHKILPLEVIDGQLRVATVDEADPDVIEDLGRTFGAAVRTTQASIDQILDGIRSAFATPESVANMFAATITSELKDFPSSSSVADARDQANQAPVIRFVNLAIRDAFGAGASDIHFDVTPSGLRVRMRIDGVLAECPSPPRGMEVPILSRIKLMAELDIAERRVPQDGRVRVRLDNQDLDLRIAIIPALHGESIVIRLLDSGGEVALDGLGMDNDTHAIIAALTKRAHGVVLTTGPTGSGKTTTLYSMLGTRHAIEEKIITIEDPIEYYLSSVTQIPVRSAGGFGFADILRSILRHDPDVIMVGELRDAATVSVAMQAALTGHLVLSSLHTNDAASAVTRLIDLGAEPYVIAAALEGIVAQRLVRRVCAHCRVEYSPSEAALSWVAGRQTESMRLNRGAGCSECRHTGFRGRIGIFESLVVREDLRRQIVATPSAESIRQLAVAGGMQTLRQDAWSKVQAGNTTVEEVIRVLS